MPWRSSKLATGALLLKRYKRRGKRVRPLAGDRTAFDSADVQRKQIARTGGKVIRRCGRRVAGSGRVGLRPRFFVPPASWCRD
jgi:hypothetical protein